MFLRSRYHTNTDREKPLTELLVKLILVETIVGKLTILFEEYAYEITSVFLRKKLCLLSVTVHQMQCCQEILQPWRTYKNNSQLKKRLINPKLFYTFQVSLNRIRSLQNTEHKVLVEDMGYSEGQPIHFRCFLLLSCWFLQKFLRKSQFYKTIFL